MTKFQVDADLRARLDGLVAEMELCDESGQTLGYFLPAAKPAVAVRSPISDDDLERRRQVTGGRSLVEIWERLGRQ